MLFTQVEFFVFFFVVWLVVKNLKTISFKNFFLLLASYYFYAYWDWRFLGLIIVSTCVDFFISHLIVRSGNDRLKKLFLFVSIFSNLGILGFFKYYNFFVESFSSVFSPLGLKLGTLAIILPIGISFYTFQTMSYTIDVYRGRIKPCNSFLNFALFVSFFPQLVAGPIVRARDLLPQIESPSRIERSGVFKGVQQFVLGLFKKVFIADRIAYFVDYVFLNSGVFNSLTLWLAALAYAIQIYCDFSGYSDMAIGVARMMGYRFKQNFKHPYNAMNITDFWRRWHISLSSWLRDYVYISFGGNRKGRFNTYRNLFLTMLLGGLWHGASWTFVFWGAWHGMLLISHKFYREFFANKYDFKLNVILAWPITMLSVLIGWIFFRAQSFEAAFFYISKMFCFSAGILWYQPFVIFAVCLVVLSHSACVFPLLKKIRYLPTYSIKTTTILFTMILLVILFYPKDFRPFIYFQF